MFNPFAQPLDVASMYSTWSSRPKGDKAGTHTNRTPYGSDVSASQPASTITPGEASGSMKLTFNAKTGQTYSRPEPIPGLGVIKRKRAVNGGEDQGETIPKRVSVEGPGGVQSVDTSVPVVEQTVRAEESPSKPCGNKACHRTLPATASGNLCEKCKEKVKKKQAKVKQRFKLEPKKNNITIKSGLVGDSGINVASSSGHL